MYKEMDRGWSELDGSEYLLPLTENHASAQRRCAAASSPRQPHRASPAARSALRRHLAVAAAAEVANPAARARAPAAIIIIRRRRTTLVDVDHHMRDDARVPLPSGGGDHRHGNVMMAIGTRPCGLGASIDQPPGKGI